MWYSITFRVKDEEHVNLVDELMSASDLFDDVWHSGFEIYGSGDRYNDRDFINFFQMITPYITEAEGYGDDEADYGSDRCWWKTTFENGVWYEYSGDICWENPVDIPI